MGDACGTCNVEIIDILCEYISSGNLIRKLMSWFDGGDKRGKLAVYVGDTDDAFSLFPVFCCQMCGGRW